MPAVAAACAAAGVETEARPDACDQGFTSVRAAQPAALGPAGAQRAAASRRCYCANADLRNAAA